MDRQQWVKELKHRVNEANGEYYDVIELDFDEVDEIIEIIEKTYKPDCEHAPSVELPEIVQCKECRFLIDHYGFMDDGYCANVRDKYGVRFKPDKDWFCADGELK